MEHKLVLGGEQYLPFARSRIKALRATGLQHASQKFEIDGVTIRVRIDGAHEYIHLEGGEQSLSMESGAMVLTGSTGSPGGPFYDDPAYLVDCGPVPGYVARFTDDTKPTDRNPTKRNPGNGSAGQFAGTITRKKGAIKGKISPDAEMAAFFPHLAGKTIAACASPQWGPYDEQKNRRPIVTDEDHEFGDLNLYEKKRGATLIPASAFTGKMRLYIQALYGKPTYNADGTEPVRPGIARVDPLFLFMWLNVHNPPQEGPEHLQTLGIDASTGLFTSPTTGKHWLVQIGNGSTSFIPLRSSKSGEELRKFTVDESLSIEDREHLEAYILAWSFPDTANTITVPGGKERVGLGYGWHWNWSGTAADVVEVESIGVEMTPTQGLMRSAHFRLTVNYAAEANRFAVVESAIDSGDWALERVSFTVLQPIWVYRNLMKATPLGAVQRNCNAPIYAFYKRDELQVLRVSVQEIPLTTSEERTFDSNLGFPYTPGEGVLNVTTYANSKTFEHQFSCGNVNTGSLTTGVFKTEEYIKHTAKEKPETWRQTTGTIGLPGANNWNVDFDVSMEKYTKSSQQKDVCRIVIPVGDAEAVYIHWNRWKEETISNRKRVTGVELGVWRTQYCYYSGSGPVEERSVITDNYFNDRVKYLSYPDDPEPPTSSETNNATGLCITKSTVNFTLPVSGMGGLSSDLLDTIDNGFFTRSGTSVIQPTTASNQTSVWVGIPTGTDPSTLVGWV